MATTTATTIETPGGKVLAHELPPKGPHGWKSRFLRRGSSRKSNGSTNGRTRSSSESSQGSVVRSDSSSAKDKSGKKGGLIRKLKTSFGKDSKDSNGNNQSSIGSGSDHGSGKISRTVIVRRANDPAIDTDHNSSETSDSITPLTRTNETKTSQVGANSAADKAMTEKQFRKERDGFCRRVDSYDGQVIVVDQLPTYELGNYLGGGVAGVVYEGHRLRPMEDYPVRHGRTEPNENDSETQKVVYEDLGPNPYFCSPVGFVEATTGNACGETGPNNEASAQSPSNVAPLQSSNNNMAGDGTRSTTKMAHGEEADPAIEATVDANAHGLLLDAQDAPSRSRHYTKAASVQLDPRTRSTPKKSLRHGLSDETVAVKILNPVGFRILNSDGLHGAVVVRKGETMSFEVRRGSKAMTEKHVWWLVNPNSRNLRTLQRYSSMAGADGGPESTTSPRGIQVDRGSPDKGLRLSLIAAFMDPKSNKLHELTLTRCLEIWGHIPFAATDIEFEEMMSAIEKVNAGQPPPALPAFSWNDSQPPSRVGTGGTEATDASSRSEFDFNTPVELKAQQTGLWRAAQTSRATVYCDSLNAFIALPAVPSKYLRWLRQRRAATKEIRNMMLIGRHKNVVHLFEVLEFIQDTKSTMFLILELVRGGELFDLISNNASKSNREKDSPDESEAMMRKYFFELASGIDYCHVNGIAHRDLKPENLLVHTHGNGERILKIADFGLSATFGPGLHDEKKIENDLMIDSFASPRSQHSMGDQLTLSSPSSLTSPPQIHDSVTQLIQSGATALSFLTCGAMEGFCAPTDMDGPDSAASLLRRMTSVVGSPHYVAPEIISQTDDPRSKNSLHHGYDGSKADVWSAGVILYAMLYRSLPFGEDLLRCPRYQSYRKWYDEVRMSGGRRSSAAGALKPITDSDERDFLGPHWFFPSTTSRESRDLIVAMLNPAPNHRLSIPMVLDHAWVALYRMS